MGFDHASGYEFTNEWFCQSKSIWNSLLSNLKPTNILEIGSYEGQSICYCIDYLSHYVKSLDIVCVDTWEDEFYGDMTSVYQRFKNNTQLSIQSSSADIKLKVCQEPSLTALADLIVQNKHPQNQRPFDLIYIDGSHYARDVLADAVMAFSLLRVGGLMIFDDYLWSNPSSDSPTDSPKIAIDSFTTIYHDKIQLISAPLYQTYLFKTAS